MASVPQLQKDLGAASLEIAQLRARVAELENAPAKMVYVDRVEYVDRPVRVWDQSEIERLGRVIIDREKEIAKLKINVIENPSVVIEYVDRTIEVPVIVNRKVADNSEIERLSIENAKLNGDIARLKENLSKKPKTVTVYREVMTDGPHELMGN